MSAPRHFSKQVEHRSPYALKPHKEAARIPVMAEDEFKAFRADVGTRGILVPIEITRRVSSSTGASACAPLASLALRACPSASSRWETSSTTCFGRRSYAGS
jgi:hypothetical protein